MKKKYALKHAMVEENAAEKTQHKKIAKRVCLCLGAAYLLVVVGATVYSQTVYVKKLPSVTLVAATGARVPKKYVAEINGQLTLNTVEQEDGPWGKRYVIHQITSAMANPIDDNTVFFYEAENLKSPIAATIDAEFVYEGMEVRIEDGN